MKANTCFMWREEKQHNIQQYINIIFIYLMYSFEVDLGSEFKGCAVILLIHFTASRVINPFHFIKSG